MVRHEAPVLEQRSVRNTSGISETRYVIREELVLGEKRWPIELTLTNRDAMGYLMLLGREAMVGRVLVDPEGSHQLGDVEPAQLEAMHTALRTECTGLWTLFWLRIPSSTASANYWRRARNADNVWNSSTSSSATCGWIYRTHRCIPGAAMCSSGSMR